MLMRIGGPFIYRGRILFPLRLNLLQINHQVQILINVNVPVVTIIVRIITPAHKRGTKGTVLSVPFCFNSTH